MSNGDVSQSNSKGSSVVGGKRKRFTPGNYLSCTGRDLCNSGDCMATYALDGALASAGFYIWIAFLFVSRGWVYRSGERLARALRINVRPSLICQ